MTNYTKDEDVLIKTEKVDKVTTYIKADLVERKSYFEKNLEEVNALLAECDKLGL